MLADIRKLFYASLILIVVLSLESLLFEDFSFMSKSC